MSIKTKECQPGHFYAVGVGPGSPDLITLRAARLIQSADTVIVPRSELAKESLALITIRDLIDQQEVIEHVYPMKRDSARTRTCWAEVAAEIATRIDAGKSVVQVTIGDPMIYSTSSYLIESLVEMLPPEHIHVVPGISAFQATAALLVEPLTLQEDRLTMMPATDMPAIGRALDTCETLVLYKVGPRLQQLGALLQERNLIHQARLACYVEQNGREVIFRDFREALSDESHGYMSTVIVRVGRRSWEQNTAAQEVA
ncbi:cobalt-sirohydrochlorin C20-methyltransferase [Syntrophotalea carbinolica DSM 2380]|uniref:Cobalt-sirohydrochlorin C20-methyltransferase n=1 Tax=Syntrophotalea carbinolica (strain DSM 2380 / NBRC 103641 / GraBd1) TaxID=338963 RepID=Q3A7A8_SYNC1|nr:precorrin-2 C(20)-methyltransferase [Syntrophotalea carbinolica]ABA87736.1 cobalt-sirohydrochlorin C20-methyltransferase [Syntrophotalea carbinolica DSM 2380]